MALRPEDFAGDEFQLARVMDCREGDIVRLRGALWQVQHTLGFAFVGKSLLTGETGHFGFASAAGLERRVGEPLPVEW